MNKFIAGILAVTLSVSAYAEDFKIITGGEGGGYERLGKLIVANVKNQASKKGLNFDYEVLNSAGSIENIERFNDGEVQAMIAQADALNVMPLSKLFKAKASHTEYVFWIYNKENGFKDIEDVEGKEDVLVVLVDGSGGMVTMRSFAKEDGGYEVNLEEALHADDLYDAVDMVADGKHKGKKVAGVLYVSTSIPAEIVADFSSKVAVGEATDGDFNDAEDVNGDSLYNNCDIIDSQLNGLSSSNTFTDLSTVCVQAMVVYTTELEQGKTAVRAIKKGINKALRNL